MRHEPNGIVRYLRDIGTAGSFLRENRVQLLHINHANYWRPAEVVAAKLLRIPILTHYHMVTERPGPFIKYSNVIAAVSEYVATTSAPRDVPKIVIHNTVRVERFDEALNIRAELGLADDDVVVSFVGQIREHKGIDLFIKMAHQIPDQGVRFLIAGECRDPNKFGDSYTEARLRAEIGVDSRIKYVGYRSDVQNIFRSSDVIVMPSRCREAFGLINIEAGAARRPIVSTRDGGIPEIVCHGDNGFLVEREDLAGLVRHTRLLIGDKELRQRMGQCGRRIVEERFTYLPVRKLEQAYDRLIRSRIRDGSGLGERMQGE